jgi:tRNA G18 (ribose-2'-O)-methylase SpoU
MQTPDVSYFAVASAFSDSARGTLDRDPELEFLLYALQSPINIGMILRVAETYRFHVSIYDPFCVLDHPDKLRTISDFSCGALPRRGFRELADDAAVARILRGRRLIATSILPTSCALPDFSFCRGDVFALGNEYDGLPNALLSQSDAVLHIPMPPGFMPKPKALHPIDPDRTAPVARDGQPNLNVAMTAGILCYGAYLRIRENDLPMTAAPDVDPTQE